MNVAQQLRAAAAERILIKDGAYGTQVQNRRLREADYAGSLGLSRDQKGTNDLLNLTQPELVRDICNSNTYQRSTERNASNENDEVNFAHARVRRIRAESLLDCIDSMLKRG